MANLDQVADRFRSAPLRVTGLDPLELDPLDRLTQVQRHGHTPRATEAIQRCLLSVPGVGRCIARHTASSQWATPIQKRPFVPTT
jgi:hypothetical protein